MRNDDGDYWPTNEELLGGNWISQHCCFELGKLDRGSPEAVRLLGYLDWLDEPAKHPTRPPVLPAQMAEDLGLVAWPGNRRRTILDDAISDIEDPLYVRLARAGWAVRDIYDRLLPRVLKVDAYADHEEIFRLAKLIQAGRRTSPEAARLARRLGLGSTAYLPRERR